MKNEKVLQQEEKIQENVKKVDLSGLPRRIYNGREVIDWKNSYSYEVPFIFGEISGKLKILEYVKGESKVYVEYNGKKSSIRTNHIQRCRIGSIIGTYKREHQYKVGEIVETNSGKIKILKQISYAESRTKEREYKYECLIDGYKGIVTEGNLKMKKGCSVCGGCRVEKEINSVWKTHPHLVKYFVNEEDSWKVSRYSNKKIKVKCECCDYIANKDVGHFVNNNGFICENCRDGNSYPNKFMGNLLKQLNVKYECEKVFDWATNRRYDFYLEEYNLICECHGNQHYTESSGIFKKTLEQEQLNDLMKRKNATENGIKVYIELDCRKSTLKHIKESIINSELNNIFDLSNVKWEECDSAGIKNSVKFVCDEWKSGERDILKLAKDIGVCEKTVRNYLITGRTKGWCDYGSDEHKIERAIERRKWQPCCKEVIVIKDGVKVGKYHSMSELIRKSKQDFGVTFSSACISRVCNGKEKHHKGYVFKYVNEKESA